MITLAGLAWLSLIAAALPFALVMSNLRIWRRLPAGSSRHLVSVLIPARNESANIGAAIASVTGGTHRELEVLVLDDDSSDATASIVLDCSRRDFRVRLIGQQDFDPSLWGKPQACAALADQARGDYLLFMDADVRLAPDAIARLAAALDNSAAALLSGIPRQRTHSLAERLVVPLMHFVLLGFLPIAMMRRDPGTGFGVACGQLLACRREAYRAAGGHRQVAHRIHDGMALARAFRAAGHMTDLADFTDIAHCRMYRSSREVLAGFAKNAHEGLGSTRGIVPWTVLLLGGQVLPFLLVPAALTGSAPLVPVALALACAGMARLALDRRTGNAMSGTLLHPVGVAALLAIQWYALLRRLSGHPVAWKARVADAPALTPRTSTAGPDSGWRG